MLDVSAGPGCMLGDVEGSDAGRGGNGEGIASSLSSLVSFRSSQQSMVVESTAVSSLTSCVRSLSWVLREPGRSSTIP